MALLDQSIANLAGVGQKTVAKPTFIANDFPDGFIISVFQDGRELVDDRVVLKGPFMPHQPFSFGGEQRLATEYYPGNSEPTVHVLGPKEKDLTIKGHLRLKKFARQYKTTTLNQGDEQAETSIESTDVRAIAEAYQQQLDSIRLQGRLVKLVMGAWHRWGFIQEVQFEFKTMAEIHYEVKFLIVGFNPPKNSKILGDDTEPIRANKDLIAFALDAIDTMETFPTVMDQGISDFLTTQISAVASAINLVTGFVDGILSDAEKLNASVNRAIGLIKNARSTISQSIRRIGTISTTVAGLGSSLATEWQKTSATIQSINHTQECKRQMFSLLAFLVALQARFEALKRTIPLVRHLVKTGDTLQNISIRYYNTADHWKDIYDHNKLTSTQLTIGAVLEIPKV